MLLTLSASLLVGCLAAVSGVQASQTPSPSATATVPAVLSEEEFARVGETLVEKVCNTSCHGLEKLDEMRRTRRDWNDQVVNMMSRGATAKDTEVATIKQYLARYYGIVAVNTAQADELSAVLGFSVKDAQAIVEYRTAHGKFVTPEALSNVPGIDTKKVEEQPDALRFD